MNCSNCGEPNRPQAKFCGRCRTPLTATVIKRCPQCGRTNRAEAKFCGHCRHSFIAPVVAKPSPRRKRPNQWLLYLSGSAAVMLTICLCALFAIVWSGREGAVAVGNPLGSTPTATVTPSSTPTPLPPAPTETATPVPTLQPDPTRATSLSSEALDRALLATVQVIVPANGLFGEGSAGSGSILTTQGHILTNFHVIGDTETGELYSRAGDIFIALSPQNLRGAAVIQYIAELVEGDPRRDLALLKIIATDNGNPLPPNLNLPTLPVGDSDNVRIGNYLSVIGFPGLGGETVTFTRGTVSGFLSENSEEWIKTDAEINFGNSGGAAINEAGELVGVPSAAAGETVDLPGKIGLVRPVNAARGLIERALREAGES